MDAAATEAHLPRWRFQRGEVGRLGGFFGAVALLHLIGWGAFLAYRGSFGSAYAATGALAYGFGLRHAFDADHISAIDDTTRLFIQRGRRPLGVGFFFSLGHSTIVFGLAVGIAVAARAVQRHIATFQNVGGILGATISGTFLWLVGILNLIVFVGIFKLWRQMRTGGCREDELEKLLGQRGFMSRLLGRRFSNLISKSWHMYPVGLLFGLGFDTASEVGLLALTAASATGAATAGGGHIPLMGIIALPVLFAAGMSLMDTADGAFMAKTYGWAFTSPVRKVFYNLTTTGLSIFVALVVGTIEYLQVLGDKLHLAGLVRLANLDFETLGYGIVAVFIVTWAGSVALFKLRHLEDRWTVPHSPTP